MTKINLDTVVGRDSEHVTFKLKCEGASNQPKVGEGAAEGESSLGQETTDRVVREDFTEEKTFDRNLNDDKDSVM